MGHKTSRARALKAAFAAGALALCMLSLTTPGTALGADEYVFDPELSLQGACYTPKAEDPVPDPGCPEGGSHSPLGTFTHPEGVAVDRFGNIYVANDIWFGGSKIRIDVFDPEGNYLTNAGYVEGSAQNLRNIAVDSKGNLYAQYPQRVVYYAPASFPPAAGTAYGSANVVYETGEGFDCKDNRRPTAIALDPSNDHLFIARLCRIAEYTSAVEGSEPVAGKQNIGEDPLELGKDLPKIYAGLAVWGKNHDVYASGALGGNTTEQGKPENQRIYVFDGGDGHVKAEIDGTEAGPIADDATPEGGFAFEGGDTALAVDQSNGELYAGDEVRLAVDRFSADGEFLTQVKHESFITDIGGIAVDEPLAEGGPEYTSPNQGYLFIGANRANSGKSHLFAFAPPAPDGPAIEAQEAGEIGETSALLEAGLNPNALATTYHFEYVTQAAFDESGYATATSVPVPDAEGGAGGSLLTVSERLEGLAPDTAYRFRLVASNEAGTTIGEGTPAEEGDDASFSTYPVEGPLPDGRAYELVSPPDTNGRIPTMAQHGLSSRSEFSASQASPDGGSVVFGTEGGSLPGLEASGFMDSYRAVRGTDGWATSFAGLDGAQAAEPVRGGISPDQGYLFWRANGGGSLASGNYLRGPGGSLEPIGIGSLGTDLGASGKLIAVDAAHVIFVSGASGSEISGVEVQLEPDAPPDGTTAIYDRTPGGPTRVVSLLPGDVTPAAGEHAIYQGVSADGSAVAFMIGEALYVRRDNAETLLVAEGDLTFGGLSEDGGRVFYLRDAEEVSEEVPAGELFACDLDQGPCAGAGSQPPPQIGSGGESVLVNVAASGEAAFLVSPQVLSGEANGEGEEAQAGAQNLYAWDGEAPRFIATLSDRDVHGVKIAANRPRFGGLGMWVEAALAPNATSFASDSRGRANDPSRSTPAGGAFVFESDASPTADDSGGNVEIYRYAAGEGLLCVSCNPTGAASSSDASLQSPVADSFLSLPPAAATSRIDNLTADGRRVFFQSAERLVPRDLDGRLDVYEWQAQGTDGCARPPGCLRLISSGRSTEDDYLYATTPDGSDVFFLSGDLLVPEDPDRTPSIYDARVGGGFPPAPAPPGECLGEACQPTAVAPDDPSPASLSFEGAGNVTEGKGGTTKPRCPKGKRKVRSKGKVRCVKPHAKKKHRKHKRANKDRRAAR